MTSGLHMSNNGLNEILKKTSGRSLLGIVTINDLRDMEFSPEGLSPKQHLALKNFDRFRINQLKNNRSEQAFNNKYLQLQAMANLMPYEEFLKEEYF